MNGLKCVDVSDTYPIVKYRAPFQQRVIDEKDDVDQKRMRLAEFFATDTYRGLLCEDKVLLREQYACMLAYALVLEARIARFT
jgi:hypothetical protein